MSKISLTLLLKYQKISHRRNCSNIFSHQVHGRIQNERQSLEDLAIWGEKPSLFVIRIDFKISESCKSRVYQRLLKLALVLGHGNIYFEFIFKWKTGTDLWISTSIYAINSDGDTGQLSTILSYTLHISLSISSSWLRETCSWVFGRYYGLAFHNPSNTLTKLNP